MVCGWGGAVVPEGWEGSGGCARTPARARTRAPARRRHQPTTVHAEPPPITLADFATTHHCESRVLYRAGALGYGASHGARLTS